MTLSDTAGRHFLQLVDYLGDFSAAHREELADLYGAEDSSADRLARYWCTHSAQFLEVVEERIVSRRGRAVLETLANEHGIELDVDWVGRAVQQTLSDLGLFGPHRRIEGAESVTFPGTLAALVAPLIGVDRSTLPILLGSLSRSSLAERASALGLSDRGSRGELFLRCADFLTAPGAVDEVTARLPNRETLGPAVMVVELGGTCFWREIFGEAAPGEESDGTVVPLIRGDRRARELEMADCLIDHAVLYRFDSPHSPHQMIAVPEELQTQVWRVGRDWLREWLRETHRRAAEGATAGSLSERSTLQAVGKWLACETVDEGIAFDEDGPPPETIGRLAEASELSEASIRDRLELLVELSVFERGGEGNELTIGSQADSLLDAPLASLVGEVLYEWTAGFAGRRADRWTARVIGLDAAWRERAVEMLRARRGAVPDWMREGGVPPEETGCGWLREVDDHPPRMLTSEIDLLTGIVWRAKVTWLDLVEQLDPGRAYRLERIAELFQLSAAHALYEEIGELLDPPRGGYYLPLERPSVLGDPGALDEFVEWTVDVVESLMGPLGVAELTEDGAVESYGVSRS
ncbi:MAG: hypothetical protein ABEL76_10830, partial [Bradymonadaceae bacterium]